MDLELYKNAPAVLPEALDVVARIKEVMDLYRVENREGGG